MRHLCVNESRIRRQAIIWTNADLFSIGHVGTSFNAIWIKIKNLFIQQNAYGNIACEMETILGGDELIVVYKPEYMGHYNINR